MSILDARMDHCRFIVGHDGLAVFCGAQVEPGRPWCPGHARIVFSPSKSSRRAFERHCHEYDERA